MSIFTSGVEPEKTQCECYKKLKYLGVPLSDSSEDEVYGENMENIHYEKTFELGGILTINPQVTKYPTVTRRNLVDIFYQMSQVISNLSDFDVNALSFWVMDVFVEGLWTAQKAGMDHEHQKATLLWIAYFFNFVQKHNPSRKELFRHLKKILFMPDYKITEYPGEDVSRESTSHQTNPTLNTLWELPLPPGMMEEQIGSVTSTSDLFSEEDEEMSTAHTKVGEDVLSERNAQHMKIILEILYRIFARLWVYLEMQAGFHTSHSAEQVKLPFSFSTPKPAPKTDPFAPLAPESSGKTSNFSVTTTDYNESERRLHRNDFILPLQSAEEVKAYVRQAGPQLPSDPSSISSKIKDKKKQG